MADDFLKLASSCESWIRNGELERAQPILRSLQVHTLKREHRAMAARLARRSHLWPLSLKILKSLIYGKIPNRIPTSTIEKMEYAFALIRAGALAEANTILSGLDPAHEPYLHFVRSQEAMARWDYQVATGHLEKFISSSDPRSYEVRVAQVNLLACSVNLDAPSSGAQLESLLPTLDREKHGLMLGNVLEIAAQYYVRHKKFADAEGALKQSEKLLASGSMSLFLVEKWRAISSAMKTQSVDVLNDFRTHALKKKHWETLRDLDYFSAEIDPSLPCAEWVYFGTPFPFFRRRLEKLRSFEPEVWIQKGKQAPVNFDPWFPENGQCGLAHRLVVAMLRDFYRPPNTSELFISLFDDQYFDYDSSINRMHKAISRAKQWIAKLDLPLNLFEMDGVYNLRILARCRLLCRSKLIRYDKTSFFLDRLEKSKFQRMTSTQWAKSLELTGAQTRSLLTEGVRMNLLDRSGSGKKTSYSLK